MAIANALMPSIKKDTRSLASGRFSNVCQPAENEKQPMKPIRLKANVSGSLARILLETPLSEDQKIVGNRLTATVLDTRQLEGWILSQGYGIEILEPLHLRESIKVQLAGAISLYEEENKS